MSDSNLPSELLSFTAQIVSAHVSNNPIPAAELPSLIKEVFRSLSATGVSIPSSEPQRPEPAVSVRKSITPAYLICLEDGKKLKLLKRHLKQSYNLSPQQYRDRWGLPLDYPMVAPEYAQRRSVLAKAIGLGRTPAGSGKGRGKGKIKR